MENDLQSRKWLLTLNNPVEHGYNSQIIKEILSQWKAIKYFCFCDEVGKEGTYHTHIFIYGSPTRFSSVKNKFPDAHIDFCHGSIQQNRDYIRKEGKYLDTDKAETNIKETFFENTEAPKEKQGQRTDLLLLYEDIKSGRSTFDIIDDNPVNIRYLDKIETTRQILRFEEFKHKFRKMHVEYRFGKTGQGKTRSVMENYGYENVYRITDNLHPFDGYKGQDVIVFEEFYSNNYRINDMLNFLDGYPLELPCRYNNKVACYTKVFINSNVPLSEQYTSIQKDHFETWEALLRRIHKIYSYCEDNKIIELDPKDFLSTGWTQFIQEELPFN